MEKEKSVLDALLAPFSKSKLVATPSNGLVEPTSKQLPAVDLAALQRAATPSIEAVFPAKAPKAPPVVKQADLDRVTKKHSSAATRVVEAEKAAVAAKPKPPKAAKLTAKKTLPAATQKAIVETTAKGGSPAKVAKVVVKQVLKADKKAKREATAAKSTAATKQIQKEVGQHMTKMAKQAVKAAVAKAAPAPAKKPARKATAK